MQEKSPQTKQLAIERPNCMWGFSGANQERGVDPAKQTLSKSHLPNWQPGILDPAKLSDNITCEAPSKLKSADIQGNHPPPQGLLYHAKHLSI